MYLLTGFGVTIGYHRLLTHRSFETTRTLKLILAFCGSIAGQGAAIRWCATHRRHHAAADREGDPHSPHIHGDSIADLLRGMWHAHMGWLFQRDCKNTGRAVADLTADPILLRIDQLYLPLVAFGILVPGLIFFAVQGTWQSLVNGMVWGGLVRICLLQHVTWCINSVCHVWGRREFRTTDESVNNPVFGILALGEGWHNNHHAFPTSARHGLRWWQFDSSWLLIMTMKRLGLIWNIQLPGDSAMQAKSLLAEKQAA
jgi:stearoyl-CoA desaturase (delta-9 desaturase)